MGDHRMGRLYPFPSRPMTGRGASVGVGSNAMRGRRADCPTGKHLALVNLEHDITISTVGERITSPRSITAEHHDHRNTPDFFRNHPPQTTRQCSEKLSLRGSGQGVVTCGCIPSSRTIGARYL